MRVEGEDPRGIFTVPRNFFIEEARNERYLQQAHADSRKESEEK